jgi:predicted molibdopterin-dependent oxidoreductase YjgC
VSNYLDRVYSDERILQPLVREDGAHRPASWDDALDRVAAGPTFNDNRVEVELEAQPIRP